MANINLLPWREERREELKKEFLTILAGCAIFGAAIILAWQLVLSNIVSNQEGRNQFLQTRIDELQQQVKEIAKLKKQKKELIARLEVIQNLQGNRPEIVHIFDEIARTLPDGVYYNSIERKGKTLYLKGTAESNNRVSSLMRRLDESEWFRSPNLKKVQASKALKISGANDFEMVVKITSPARAKKAEENKKKKSKKKAKKK